LTGAEWRQKAFTQSGLISFETWIGCRKWKKGRKKMLYVEDPDPGEVPARR